MNETLGAIILLALPSCVLFGICWAMWPVERPHYVAGCFYTAREYHAWKAVCDDISAKHQEWRSHFPQDAFVDMCSFVFKWRDGRIEPIDRYMASLGYPQPPHRVPISPRDLRS